MRLELEDLPPRYRAQAEAQLNRKPTPAAPLPSVAKQFDSRGEYEYYMGTVLPGMAAGTIKACEQHPRFELWPPGEYGGKHLRQVIYHADFRLEYADGTIEIIEIKSKFVRKMQRDYPVRRRAFIEKYCRPNGWKFTEIMTADDKTTLEEWRKDTGGNT